MGLRRPDDPRILNTLKITDDLLRAETPSGIAFYRYNTDGYGEHADGSPFNGTGIGRAWPLLAGERGHYAVLAGQDAKPWLEAMMRMTGPGGLIPEQVWDTDDIPERGLFKGKPTGSAMPLVWAHAEFLKLLATQATGRPTELLEAVHARYQQQRPDAPLWHWRANSPFALLPAGKSLIIEADEAFVLHWSLDGWTHTEDTPSKPTAFGLNGVRLAAEHLPGEGELKFTLYYPGRKEWSHVDESIHISADGKAHRMR
jgi:glucoamylase